MAETVGPVEVHGLKEFNKALKEADKKYSKELRAANVAASRRVVTRAKAIAAMRGGVAAKAATSLRALASVKGAQIKLGGDRYPYALGAEFGSLQFRQFPTWRGNQWVAWGTSGVGYFLHPAIRDQYDEIVEEYGEAIDRIMRDAFPD